MEPHFKMSKKAADVQQKADKKRPMKILKKYSQTQVWLLQYKQMRQHVAQLFFTVL